jgi:hypothetical protein
VVKGFNNNNMKKNFFIRILIFLMLLIDISCHNNRLKTNEKELAKEIGVQEKAKKAAEKTALEKESSETRIKPTGSFRKKEIRSVDPQRPPVKIDIMGTLNNSRKLKLSDVASSIRYVKLQTLPDTLLLYDLFFYRPDLDSKIRSDGEQIIFQGIFGLTRFSMQGEYLETIWKNQTGIRFLGSRFVTFGGPDFFGVMPNIPINLRNGDLYFTFQDGPKKMKQILKYKTQSNRNITEQSETEIPDLGIIPGDTLLNTGNLFNEGFSSINGTSDNSWVGINNKWNAFNSGTFMVTYNSKGDTLCKFSDFDKIMNFKQQQYRSAVPLINFTFKGLVTLKPEYNDTVFRVIPPNRLMPAYIINFGKFRVEYMDGLNPNYDLSEKLMIHSLFETNDFIFIRYTQNHDGPTNRKKKVVKFYNAIFFKKEGKLFQHPGYTLVPEGLTNDLDGGIPFWPDFVTPQDEMMKLVSGRVLKDYINSDNFKKSTFSEEKKQKQISMASGLRPTDMIVVIVK